MTQEESEPEAGRHDRPSHPAALTPTTTIARLVPDSAAHGPLSTNPNRPSTSGTAPHPRTLEGLGDALLQRTTILAVIQMATALALQRPANFFAGQPGSKNEDLPRHLANTSNQVRLLAYTDDDRAASWYSRGSNGHYALLIHPHKFSAFVSMELLPALISTDDNVRASPMWTDPFRVQTWCDEACREVLTSNQDAATQTEYVWTTVQ